MGDAGKDALRVGCTTWTFGSDRAKTAWLSWGGALHWCSKVPATEPGKGQMENVRIAL